ncbi:cobalt-precorrin-6A reductase [Roseovarius indicus]|uniref:Precorrin-6A reductase n=1 Tax=Roseovarius indicus TaxID=540747 RepID=A0A0T5P800_9RHOB|nr:cobalt-precorrin-6A reductase [Roseovarius indicus]KRS17339.1 precorrin-6x reductase [Roseovarius indicus]QEW26511.1 Precorrin-6A reductase [Roseovarius indicus]SFD64171.1 precorrin-6A reductase [Roseovarius indicus]
MKLLLLAGTGEAQQVAKALVERDIPAVASLAGATRAPKPTGLPTRIGGFGGEEGFAAFLEAEGITAVLDATHPYAHRISERTARICKEKSVPYCQILRPEWIPGPKDRWTQVQREEDVAALVPEGATVFLATGRQTLDRFANMGHAQLICRQIDPPDRPFPFVNGRFLVGRPPFSVEEERNLFQELGVDWLVVKNAGGAAAMSKLVAARELGLDVAMIVRPPQPDALKVASVAEALDWVEGL